MSNRIEDAQKKAIEEVENYLINCEDGSRIDPPFPKDETRKNGFQTGWRITKTFSNKQKWKLNILVDGDFPYTPPRVRMEDAPEILSWPHLEKEGFLCILNSESAVSKYDPVGVVKYMIKEACGLIKANIAGKNKNDFKEGFLSYWGYGEKSSNLRYISLIEPNKNSRAIKVWKDQKRIIVGEDDKSLSRWLKRRGIKKEANDFHQGVLIFLPEPPTPSEYPNNGRDIFLTIKEHAHNILVLLRNIVNSKTPPAEIYILLGACVNDIFCYGGLILKTPERVGPPGRKTSPVMNGFRPGHGSLEYLLPRYNLEKINVNRVDHFWVHGRDQDKKQHKLREAKVAILGCGSIGSSVANLLAQSGVGNICLVDKERLDWPNIGRHTLGADSIDKFKAEEIATFIKRSYPHLGEITYKNIMVGLSMIKDILEFAEYNLIINTMGNWAAGGFLNDLQQQEENFPQILYGWTEAYAIAGHAVLIPHHAPACFQCGFGVTGIPTFIITEWKESEELLSTPQCGVAFAPYGPVQLSRINALIADTAINALINPTTESKHRIWVGEKKPIRSSWRRVDERF